MIALGVETSCDETSCGIVDGDLRLLANSTFTQLKEHERFGGVVPEIAARAHLEKIGPVVTLAFKQAGLTPADIDLFSFTRGPGLIGPLLVGAAFTQGLVASAGRPCTGMNHLEGHLGAVLLTHPALEPPFICLTVSGGHTDLCLVEPGFRYQLLGRTRDDAAGEAFDKCGKLLGLGYPAGPRLAKMAEGGDATRLTLPVGLDQADNFEFSFSGLKTAVLRAVQALAPAELEARRADICASLQAAIATALVKKCKNAMRTHGLAKLAVCGGVSANQHLRDVLAREGERDGFAAFFPERALCTDNGAMIAAAVLIRMRHGTLPRSLEVDPSLGWV